MYLLSACRTCHFSLVQSSSAHLKTLPQLSPCVAALVATPPHYFAVIALSTSFLSSSLGPKRRHGSNNHSVVPKHERPSLTLTGLHRRCTFTSWQLFLPMFQGTHVIALKQTGMYYRDVATQTGSSAATVVHCGILTPRLWASLSLSRPSNR